MKVGFPKCESAKYIWQQRYDSFAQICYTTVGQLFLVQKFPNAGYLWASLFGENWTEAENLKTPKSSHYVFDSQDHETLSS